MIAFFIIKHLSYTVHHLFQYRGYCEEHHGGNTTKRDKYHKELEKIMDFEACKNRIGSRYFFGGQHF